MNVICVNIKRDIAVSAAFLALALGCTGAYRGINGIIDLNKADKIMPESNEPNFNKALKNYEALVETGSKEAESSLLCLLTSGGLSASLGICLFFKKHSGPSL